MPGEAPFKKCSLCAHIWPTRAEFLADPNIRLEGYQVNFGDLTAGIFIFTHSTMKCGTSLGLEAGRFADLYKGAIFEERMEGTRDCSGMCNHSGVLDPCRKKCECAFVREILQIVRNWKKNAA
jgi:hypothetical protein